MKPPAPTPSSPSADSPSDEEQARSLEAWRNYLLLIAAKEMPRELRAKGGASDLVQETFLVAHKKFGRLRDCDERQVGAWLRQILMYRIAAFRRSYTRTDVRQIGREVSLEAQPVLGAELASDLTSPSEQASRREREELLGIAIGGLSARDRAILSWWRQDQLSHEEIGQRLNISPDAARKAREHALKRLFRVLGPIWKDLRPEREMNEEPS